MSVGKTPVPPKSGEHKPPERPRILIADDDAAIARAYARVLVTDGYDVVSVKDGAEAAEALMRGPFDAVVSDVHMPGMTGVELLSLVRAYDLDVPVILMTGDPSVETAAQAVELGALQYMVKPVSSDALKNVVRRAVKLNGVARARREILKVQGGHEGQAGDLAGLRVAFDRAMEQMWVAFQPIVDPKKRVVFAYEALLRTSEPALPTPKELLEAAERLELLPELARRIHSLAAEAMPNAPGDALLFVNLHPRDLLDPTLFEASMPLGKIASRVVLEITERATLDEIRDLERRAAVLRYMGFRLAVDDLGAGYAGLTSFARLEPEFVKLDISLVQQIHASPVRQKLVESMTTLCRDLGIQVIAEGVEAHEDRDNLFALGCRLQQGYFFAKPGRPFPSPKWEP
jgi:EAL domain-containing protein (putative c-di-GMP-specific phosphodiesterase class I)/ActR/RegA family two-component response regulator